MKSISILICLMMVFLVCGAWAKVDYSPIQDFVFHDNMNSGSKPNVMTKFLKTPLHFVANQGQMDESVFYYAKTDSGTVYCTDQGLIFGFAEGSISLKFLASKPVKPQARSQLPGRINYYIGNDPAEWQTDVPTFGEIFYNDVYPGIDLIYSGHQGRLKFTFYIHPGADPGQIQMSYEDAQEIQLDEAKGEVIIKTSCGEVRDALPSAYQEIDGVRQDILAFFRLIDGNSVGFQLGDYDHESSLIIDPLIYSTYLGGSDYDWGYGIAVDSSGNAYITGWTCSDSDFPIKNAFQNSHGGGSCNAFVTKLSSDGKLAYSTYLGGSDGDWGYGIAVDISGNAYITGWTCSDSDFPIKNAFQSDFGGGLDAFVMELSSDGKLVYSTYLGGVIGIKALV